jgi:hypothetical protein
MRLHKALIVFATIFFLTALAAEEDRLVSTGVAPGAEGKIITNVDRNGNTEVEVQVKHLANAQKLTPAKQAYVIWVQGRGKDPEPLGTLRVNENLEGSLKATTPYKAFDIFVTAEDKMQPEAPSSTVVMRGSADIKEK